MQVFMSIKASKLKQLQVLVGQYGLRWIFDPYPVSRDKDGEWRVGIDYNGVSEKQARNFDMAWMRLNRPIRESVRSYPWYVRAKRFIRHHFSSLVFQKRCCGE